MTFLLVILLVITCAVLAFFVLIQNPKGGGLSGSFGGLGNQMMGARQSTDVVEKGTWITAAVLLVLTLGSFVITPKQSKNTNEKTRSEKVNKGAPAQQAPQGQQPQGGAQPQQGQSQQPQGQQPQPAPAK